MRKFGSRTNCLKRFIHRITGLGLRNHRTLNIYVVASVLGLSVATHFVDDKVSSVSEKLWGISAGNVFTAHNAQFDLGFLHAESERVGINEHVEVHIDTLELSRRTTGADTTRRHNLFALCEHYGIEREKEHDAKSDATATAQLLMHLMKELGVETVDQVAELFAP